MDMSLLSFISLVTRLSGIGILIFLVIPRAYGETKVHDGIAYLRRIILIAIAVYTFMQFIGWTSLITNPDEVAAVYAIIRTTFYFQFLGMIQSLGTLIIAIILYLIYTKDYGTEHPLTRHKY